MRMLSSVPVQISRSPFANAPFSNARRRGARSGTGRRIATLVGPGIALGLVLGLATACDVGGIDDAGTTDGGARPDAGEELDAGADAGLVDGGQHDSGTPIDVDGGNDAGTDAGEPDPCALADPLAAVGTLAVGSGFSVVESATFGNGNALSSPMWIQEEGSTTSLYRIDDAGNIVGLF